jgi:hypothetical protein
MCMYMVLADPKHPLARDNFLVLKVTLLTVRMPMPAETEINQGCDEVCCLVCRVGPNRTWDFHILYIRRI